MCRSFQESVGHGNHLMGDAWTHIPEKYELTTTEMLSYEECILMMPCAC